MEDKVIIQSKTYAKKTFLYWVSGISFSLFAVLVIFPSLFTEISDLATNSKIYKDIAVKYEKGVALLPEEENILDNYSSAARYAWGYVIKGLTQDVARALFIGLVFFIAGLGAWVLISRMTVTVTKSRIVGRSLFGRKTEIPLDAVSAFGTNNYKGIYIASASNKMNFLLISNRNEVLEHIRKLINARHDRRHHSPTEEIREYKALLDEGLITIKEYDKKKKQLLNK